MPVSLAIVGSRTVAPSIGEIDLMVEKLPLPWDGAGEGPEAFKRVITEVVDPMADGGDYAGRLWAEYHGIPVHEEPITDEDWARWGKYRAPKVRNARVADKCSIGLAFWDGESNGTTDYIARMNIRSKTILVVPSPKAAVKLKRPRARR